MYIILVNRPDRMGANLSWYIMQIIYAHYHKYFIHRPHLHFSESIFIKTIIDYTEKYNHELGEEFGSHDHGNYLSWILNSQQDWPGNNMIVCNNIQCDLVSYFKKNIYSNIKSIWDNYTQIDPIIYSKKIGVHLRLDDVVDRPDYNGIYCTEYYRDKLNNGNINIDLEEERQYCAKRGIQIDGWGRYYNHYDCQAPINETRVQLMIDIALQKYSDHEVVIVASTIGTINLPYPQIRSGDMDEDLAVLCNCDVLICSRSLYCFCSVYLGNATEIYIPMWGHIAGTGLMSKYDQTKNITYWY